jgi:hypothetical protein
LDGETLASTLGPVLQHYLVGDLDAPVTGGEVKKTKTQTARPTR